MLGSVIGSQGEGEGYELADPLVDEVRPAAAAGPGTFGPTQNIIQPKLAQKMGRLQPSVAVLPRALASFGPN